MPRFWFWCLILAVILLIVAIIISATTKKASVPFWVVIAVALVLSIISVFAFFLAERKDIVIHLNKESYVDPLMAEDNLMSY